MILDNAFRPDVRVMKEARILLKKGFDISLLCWDRSSDLPKREKTEGFEIERFKIRSGKQLGIKQIKSLLIFYSAVFSSLWKKRKQYDLIWIHDYPCLLIGLILRLLMHIPLVYDAHEIYHLMEYEKYPSYIRNLLKYSEILFVQFVDKFITVNELRSRYYRKYYRKRIYILGNWFAPIDLNRKNSFQQVQKREERFTIGYFGTLAKIRGLDLLLELAGENKEISIVIAGRGAEEDYLRKVSTKLGNVEFLGWVENIYPILPRVDTLYYVLDDKRVYSSWNSPNNLYLSIAANIPLITNSLGESGAVMQSLEPSIILRKNSVEELSRVVSLLQDWSFYESLKKKMLPLRETYNFDQVEATISSILDNFT